MDNRRKRGEQQSKQHSVSAGGLSKIKRSAILSSRCSLRRMPISVPGKPGEHRRTLVPDRLFDLDRLHAVDEALQFVNWFRRGEL
jgi:hypothetical protein